MKDNNKKTQPEKEIERLKSKPFSEDVKEVVRKKEAFIKKPSFNK